MKLSRNLVITVLIFASMSLTADQYATTLRDTTLVDKPFRDASTVGELTTDTRVLVLKRKGGWYQVQGDQQTGWVRLTSLRLKRGKPGKGKASAPGQQKKRGNDLDSLGEALTDGLFTTGSSSSLAPTTAIRGLDEENIGNAEPAPEALALLDKYKISSEQAERFASQAGLVNTRLDYFEGDSARKGSGGLLDFFSGGGNTTDEETDSQ